MFDASLAILLLAVLLGCYLQTISGFASGMVVMGIAGGYVAEYLFEADMRDMMEFLEQESG